MHIRSLLRFPKLLEMRAEVVRLINCVLNKLVFGLTLRKQGLAQLALPTWCAVDDGVWLEGAGRRWMVGWAGGREGGESCRFDRCGCMQGEVWLILAHGD